MAQSGTHLTGEVGGHCEMKSRNSVNYFRLLFRKGKRPGLRERLCVFQGETTPAATATAAATSTTSTTDEAQSEKQTLLLFGRCKGMATTTTADCCCREIRR
jgi:hypothetical protein